MPADAARRGLRAAAALAIGAALAAPASALADEAAPRTARVSSGVDPSLAYDLADARATLDPATGTLTLAVDLHAALPAPAPGGDDDAGVTIALAAAAALLPGDAGGSRCQPTAPGTSAGDASVTFAAAPPPASAQETAVQEDQEPPPAPELTATATIAPDPLPRTLPVALAADRRRLTATLVDPLLVAAAPTCLVVRAHGRAVGAPAEAPDAEELSAWFDGQRPPVDDPGGPSDRPPPSPSMPPPHAERPAPSSRPSSLPDCPSRPPAGLTWGAFPRELAVRGSALVPVQARPGRDVRKVVASLTTVVGGRALGPPVLIALPSRGYALKLQAPPQPGRLDARLSWQERRDGADCAGRSRSFRIAVVEPRAPRLSVATTAQRLTLAWGLPGRDCHALLPRGLRVRVAGVGQRRDYRVERPCDGWEEPGAALPDVAARRADGRLQLSPLGDTPGLWRYRLSAVSNGRTLLRGDLLIEVTERGGTTVRTIRLQRDGSLSGRRGRAWRPSGSTRGARRAAACAAPSRRASRPCAG